MENPQCLMLSMIKVEEGQEFQMKQEPVDENPELEIIQVDESVPVEETTTEPAMADAEDSLDALLTFSEEDMSKCDRPVDIVQRRRLRFSEEDDIMLLRQVAKCNPYKCSSLWKEITRVVGERAGKNFSVRSVRDHTDLLMNSFSLRGSEVCLKRTPPQHWEKKKRLLQVVFSMWKRELLPSRTSTADAAKSNKGGKDASAEDQLPSQKPTNCPETPKSNLSPLSTSATVQPGATSTTALSPPSLSSPLLKSLSTPSVLSSTSTTMQPQSIPLTLHFSAPVRSIVCPPMLSSALQPSVSHLAIHSQTGLQKPTVATTSLQSPSLGTTMSVLQKPSPVQSAPDLIADTISTEPLRLSVPHTLPAPSKAVSVPLTVDRSTSPIPSLEGLPMRRETGVLQSSSSSTVVDYSTSTSSPNLHRPELNSMCLTNRKRKNGSMMGARLEFLKRRHRDQCVLRRRELELEKHRLILEERRLSLEERKVQLDEEKWLFDKKEREEKLLIMSEEREHKMAMERRQQNMIDILLELKKKE